MEILPDGGRSSPKTATGLPPSSSGAAACVSDSQPKNVEIFHEIKETIHLSFPSHLRLVPPVVFYLADVATRLDLIDPKESVLPVALDEALTNAVIHGNRQDPGRLVHVEAVFTLEKMTITVRDEGSGFRHGSIPDPQTANRKLQTHGRGLYLIHSIVDEVRFNQAGNEVTLVHFSEIRGKDPKPATSSIKTQDV